MKERTSAKSSLFLMELIIVILFFSIFSAVCMMVFAHGKTTTDASRDLSYASMAAQSCADVYKAADGDLEDVQALLGGDLAGDSLTVYYDDNWQPCASADACYLLAVTNTEDSGYLKTAQVVAGHAGGDNIFSLTVKTAGGE